MNQKLRAVKRAAGLLAIAAIIPVILNVLFTFVSVAVLTYAAVALFVVFFAWLTYSMCLDQIQREDTLQTAFDKVAEISKKY
jgi:hypothetical protein